ncbi:MAG TPA: TetR/AcrR family transcriptional regulator [Cellulomonas sp.]
MPAPTRLAVPATSALPASPVAARILSAASRLFYADGIRAVSADRVIAEAGVSKVTFYRHYPTKDALVVAYLTAVSQSEREAVAASVDAHPDDPATVLRGYAATIGRESCAPGFRGCAFINAAAEYADPDHPVRAVVAEHRGWLTGTVATLLAGLDVDDPAATAAELVMLRDGAMVAGYVGSPEVVAAALDRAGTAIVAGHRAPTPGTGDVPGAPAGG